MVVGYSHQALGSVIDWEQRWSREARRKQLPSLHGIVSKYSAMPGMVAMHGGLPPSDSFPFTSLGGGLMDVGAPDVDDMLDICDPKTVAAAQQYNMQPKGHAPLVAWARDMVISLHKPATLNPSNPPPAAPVGMEVVVTQGSSAALDSLCRMLLNPGDPVLLEEYTYAHVVEADLIPMGCELLPIKLDAGGLSPSHLDSLMTSLQSSGLTLPRVLYTIPTGQNPTGSVMSQQRMAEVYQLAQKWDLVIIEDDAYYWLQYPDGPDKVPGLNLRPGFLSLDTDGRVIRIDTLAKLLGPGFRLGWLAAPPALAAKFSLYTSGISIGANMLSQVMVYEMLNKWGREGFECYVKKLQRRYAQNAAVAAAAAAEHLDGLAEWQPARAGMFMWLKMTGPNADSSKLIDAAAEAQVMVVPGHLISVAHLQAAANEKFSKQQQQQQHSARDHTEQQQEQHHVASNAIEPSPFFRVSFVTVGPETLQEGFCRLAAAIRAVSSSNSSSNSEASSDSSCDAVVVSDLRPSVDQFAGSNAQPIKVSLPPALRAITDAVPPPSSNADLEHEVQDTQDRFEDNGLDTTAHQQHSFFLQHSKVPVKLIDSVIDASKPGLKRPQIAGNVDDVLVPFEPASAFTSPGSIAVRLRHDSSGLLQPPTPPATDDATVAEAELVLAMST